MRRKVKRSSRSGVSFGKVLGIEQLTALTAELQNLRTYQPLIRQENGKYVGNILGFVKGLRLSAGIIYFLRELLSSEDLEVNWGHILDSAEHSCSPECDIIVHKKGHVRKWNGGEAPVMDFRFVRAEKVRAVVSCKSQLTAIDKAYPKALKRYGVKKIFLLAESCEEAQLPRLHRTAKEAGYSGLWCLYQTQKLASPFKTDERMLIGFRNAVYKAICG
ncbi:MAG: DUF6602 domain-containing protein [Candidatus Binatus sp.]|uniref:DUF6602 domain-containing protein n=1 Tax=Candidatus Binatus sp. TaxID=2811406 RepID=UPI003C72E20D